MPRRLSVVEEGVDKLEGKTLKAVLEQYAKDIMDCKNNFPDDLAGLEYNYRDFIYSLSGKIEEHDIEGYIQANQDDTIGVLIGRAQAEVRNLGSSKAREMTGTDEVGLDKSGKRVPVAVRANLKNNPKLQEKFKGLDMQDGDQTTTPLGSSKNKLK